MPSLSSRSTFGLVALASTAAASLVLGVRFHVNVGPFGMLYVYWFLAWNYGTIVGMDRVGVGATVALGVLSLMDYVTPGNVGLAIAVRTFQMMLTVVMMV